MHPARKRGGGAGAGAGAGKRSRVANSSESETSDSDSDSDTPDTDSESESESESEDRARVPRQERDKGWLPRLAQTWEAIVEAAVRVVRPPVSKTRQLVEHLDRPTRRDRLVMHHFVEDRVMAYLLKARLHDVLFSFDARGLSFAGFMETWEPHAQGACKQWLQARLPAAVPRVFVSHDYRHRRRRTWTLRDVLHTLNSCDWVENTRAAVLAGVHLGTPERPECLKSFLGPFAKKGHDSGEAAPSPELLRRVLGQVLVGHVDTLHWVFETEGSWGVHAWAMPTVVWFQQELKRKDIADAIAAAAWDTDTEADE
jgi:hypothetical protein